MILRDPHLYRPSRERLWQALAQRVKADPACLELPLANIERWLVQGRLQSAPPVGSSAGMAQAAERGEAFAGGTAGAHGLDGIAQS